MKSLETKLPPAQLPKPLWPILNRIAQRTYLNSSMSSQPLEGHKLHLFSVDCERRSIAFLPYKRTEKDVQGNESKKARLEGGGGSNRDEKRTQCNSFGKYHLGTCDPNRGKGGEKSSSSSSSSSSKSITPGKYDKYKSQDAGKKINVS